MRNLLRSLYTAIGIGIWYAWRGARLVLPSLFTLALAVFIGVTLYTHYQDGFLVLAWGGVLLGICFVAGCFIVSDADARAVLRRLKGVTTDD